MDESIPLLNPSLSSIPQYPMAAAPSDRMVRLASNENPWGPSPEVREALRDVGSRLSRYPDPSASWLRERIASHLGLDAASVMVGNGATELLDLIARAFLAPGQHAMYARPSFVMYRIAPMSMGAEVREIPMVDGRLDIGAMMSMVDRRTKLVYLANPNNPTGTYLSASELRSVVRSLPSHVVLVIDEAYREYAVADDFPDARTLLPERERMVVVRTFSKCHGLAALRVGYLIAAPTLVRCLDRARLPFNVNAFAQVAAAAALEDTAHVRAIRAANRREMAFVQPRLESLGLEVTPSQANFLLVDLGWDGAVKALRRRDVLVRSMAPYGLSSSARITLGTRSQNRRLLDALGDALAERRRLHQTAA